MPQFRVSIGHEFEATDSDEGIPTREVEFIYDAESLKYILRHRRFLWIFWFTGVPFVCALAIAAVMGAMDGSYDELEAVWNAASNLLPHIWSG